MTPDDPIDRTAYVDTFFKELSPAWLNYVVALHGVAPVPLDGPFAYAELGCGFGQTVVTNAAAFPAASFAACDINPLHIDAARRYADALGVRNLDVVAASFDEFARRALPALDFVVLHGVYSWVGAEAKRAVRSFIDRHLKPGGITYVSYNSLPGWAVEVPLRRLFRELAAGEGADIDAAVSRALRSLDGLADAKLAFFTAYPTLRDVAKSLAGRAPGYLAHEYLGERWNALYSIDVADELAEVGLRYVGSATLADNHPALTTSDDTVAAIAALPTVRQRRLADDFATNRAFRRDVFVRGGVANTNASHLGAIPIGRLASAESLATRVRVPRGMVTFQDAYIDDLRTVLSGGPLPIAAIVERLRRASSSNDVVRNLTILIAAGELMPFASADVTRARTAEREATTRAALAYAVEHRVGRALPNSLLGNGVELSAVDALAVSEWCGAATAVDALTRRVAERLRRECWEGIETLRIDAVAGAAAVRTIDTLAPMLRRLGAPMFS